MARYLEALPASHRADLGLPLMRLALFDRGIVLDHAARRAFAVRAPDLAKAFPGAAWGSDREWLGVWSRAARVRSTVAPVTGACSREMERDTFERLVARAIEYIRAGDIYQVNLSHRFRLAGIDDPLVVYAAVRRANPAPYAALLSWDDGAVASASPELFLRVRDRAVRTQPIKGTRPRTGIPARDELLRRELLASPKEAAELTMIVDLHRNDLGRVCEYGSVRVAHARRLEAHPTVFHTVADIAGRLAPGRDALDLLMACFPAGSISGVPKIRALQIIDELEPVARGVYTGAIGVLGLDGQMTLNVAIRTLQIRGGEGTLYVGGGIVADSDPSAEYEETIAKARGILTGLQRTGQSVDFAQTA
jgi:para-aminobenzoate synthetase component 1